jgi:ribosomal protein S18 acetylase RimI-like enzyme
MSAFREIAEHDVARMVKLWQDCGLARPPNDPYKDISFARTGRHSTILVREENGAVIASIMAGHDGHRGMLYYVAVDPSHQRQDHGRQAVRMAETSLGAQGVWKVTLLIRAENEAVRGFYKALGYEVDPVMCMARRIVETDQISLS